MQKVHRTKKLKEKKFSQENLNHEAEAVWITPKQS